MADDPLLVRVSAALDGELDSADATSLPELLSPGAARFDAEIRRLRALVRVRQAEAPPDLVPAVLSALPDLQRRDRAGRRRLAIAAALTFVAGATGGAVVGGLTDRGARSALASLADDLLDAQADVDELAAELTIIEHGWDPHVPVRTYTGHVSFEAPARLTLVIADTTAYPVAWPANDVVVLIDETSATTSGRIGCSVQLRPDCLREEPVVRRVVDRVPFSSAGARVEGAPLGVALPLDLVVPVGAFVSPGLTADTSIAVERVDGALAVSATVGRMESVVGALLSVGDWRALHATDLVTLTLDAETLTLRGLVVTAGAGLDRDRWALRSGYDDVAGQVLLEVVVNPVPRSDLPAAPAVTASPMSTRSEGFVPLVGGLPAPEPGWLPDGFEPYVEGRIEGDPTVGLRSYSDGRAWLTVRAVSGWDQHRLFGEIDALAQPVDVPGGGRVYLDPSGTRVGLHGTDLDVELAGSIGPAALLRVASELGVVGYDVPPDWVQAPTDDVAPAGALATPRASAVRVDDGVVTVLVPGPGRSGFSVVQHPGTVLDPPSSPDALAIEVRGVIGRWDPLRDNIEWVENGWVIRLRSEGLGVAEMVAEAEDLSP